MHRQPAVWRAGRLARISCWIVVALTAPLGLICAVGGAVGGLPATGAAQAATITALLALLAWRLGLHPEIVSTPDALLIRNPVRSTAVPWADVAECRPGSSGIRIVTRSGHYVTAWAVQKGSIWTRPTRADHVCGELNARQRTRAS
jgi:hypothetical protein